MDYSDYLQTDHWKKLAAETRRLAGNRCQVCNAEGELHIHHRTYERKGDEFQSDLTCLCSNCHALFHGVGEYAPFSLTRIETPILETIKEDRAESRLICVSLDMKGEVIRDKRRSMAAYGILRSVKGNDKFMLVYNNKDGTYQAIEYPSETTNITDEIIEKLKSLIGEAGNIVVDGCLI